MLDASGIKPFYSLTVSETAMPWCCTDMAATQEHSSMTRFKHKRDLGNLADFTCFRNHIVAHNVKKLVKPVINDSPTSSFFVWSKTSSRALCCCIYLHSASLLLALMRPMGPSVTTYMLVSPTSSFIVSFLSQLVSSIPAATFSCYITALISSVEQKLWNALFLMWNTHEALWSRSRWW